MPSWNVNDILSGFGSDYELFGSVHDFSTFTDLRVVGPLRSEIASIGGVEILARGDSAPARSPAASRGVNIRSCDVIAVGDTPAHSGTLLERDGEYWLASIDTIQLAPPVPQAIAKLVGRRVYIAGRTTDGMLRVQAFGAIGSR